MTRTPIFGASFVLALIWIFYLTDFHSHMSSLSELKSNSTSGSWFPSWHGSSSSTPSTSSQDNQPRTLILFAFFETPLARQNMEFFLNHGLHDGADFLFVINGETNVTDLIPSRSNIRYVQRENKCYDLGAFAEVLTKGDLYKQYDRFITMNASLRGPFFPQWSTSCWSDMYLNRLTDKLVGMTLGCLPLAHVQSMIWATDRIGLETLLFPSESLIAKFKSELPIHNHHQPVPPVAKPGINQCPEKYWAAVAVEVHSTPLIRSAGYDVDVMMSAYHGIEDYEHACLRWGDGDMLSNGHYWGMSMHPFDTIFAKTNRGNDPVTLKKLTEWTDWKNYSSYDVCR